MRILEIALLLFNYKFIKIDDSAEYYTTLDSIIKYFVEKKPSQFKILCNINNNSKFKHWVIICKYQEKPQIYYFDSLKNNIIFFNNIDSFESYFRKFKKSYYFLVHKNDLNNSNLYENPLKIIIEKYISSGLYSFKHRYNNLINNAYFNKITKNVPVTELIKNFNKNTSDFCKFYAFSKFTEPPLPV